MYNKVEYYIREQQKLQENVKQLEKTTNRLGLLRLVAFTFCIVGLSLGFADHNQSAKAIGIISALVFIYGVVIYEKRVQKLHYYEAGLAVYQRYIDRYNEEWKSFPDTGKDFLKGDRIKYKEEAMDLDLFGTASLFQYMNVAASRGGRSRLKDWLTSSLSDKENDWKQEDILKRQEAVKELIDKDKESINLETLALRALKEHERELQQDVAPHLESFKHNKKGPVIVGVFAALLVLITWFSFAAWLLNWMPISSFIAMLAIQFVVSQAVDSMLFMKSYAAVPCLSFLNAYEEYLQGIADTEFESEILKGLQGEIAKDSQKGIKGLRVIGEALNIRHNPLVYGMLCMTVFYNAYVYIAFVRWARKYGERIYVWLDSIAEMEALLSLATIGRTRKIASFPKLMEGEKASVSMKEMCHPLIAEHKVVGNDVMLVNQVRLITGSNMSGKTTYLRALGVNMVLAYAGAPVCALDSCCGHFKIFTSMRVVDDVSNGISTFYAEVLRIRKMVSYAEKKMPMLVLVDEIFKGTNSADRIVGAKAVIRELCKPFIIGMVSTHDFELCDLANELSMLSNYHFDEYFEEDKLKFEYMIKEGKCTTTNALHILKMAGIYNE